MCVLCALGSCILFVCLFVVTFCIFPVSLKTYYPYYDIKCWQPVAKEKNINSKECGLRCKKIRKIEHMNTCLSKIVCNVARINIDFYLHPYSLAQRNYDFCNTTFVKSDQLKIRSDKKEKRKRNTLHAGDFECACEAKRGWFLFQFFVVSNVDFSLWNL